MIDIQAGVGKTRFRIESVGITGLKYPIIARDSLTGEMQRAAADWRMGVALQADRRGTHMSRLITELHARSAEAMDLDAHYDFASLIAKRLDAPKADLMTEFTWFREVKAPVTGLSAWLEGKVAFVSETGDRPTKTLVVTVPAKSLCPCSKAISERGAHNQRSDIKVSTSFELDAPVIGINKLMELVERSASSPIYPVLKREDEKHITEHAYDNPVFVEDIVRNAAERLFDLPSVKRFVVEAVNRESIHAHDAFARVAFER